MFADQAWREVPLAHHVSAALGGFFEDPARVDALNAAHAAVLAITFDRTRARWRQEHEDQHSTIAMVVRLQGGISAGTIQVARHIPRGELAFLTSRLLVGTKGFAGELAHLPISASVVQSINKDRPRGLAPISNWECSCGQHGHLEGMASARALLRRLQQSNYPLRKDGPIGRQISGFADTPDAVLRHAYRDIGRLLGRGLASPILMLDPANITISGYLACQNVVDGITQEHHRWDAGIPSSVTIDFLDGNDNLLVERRGAALAMFRQKLFRQMHVVANSRLRQTIITPLARDYLHTLASSR